MFIYLPEDIEVMPSIDGNEISATLIKMANVTNTNTDELAVSISFDCHQRWHEDYICNPSSHDGMPGKLPEHCKLIIIRANPQLVFPKKDYDTDSYTTRYAPFYIHLAELFTDGLYKYRQQHLGLHLTRKYRFGNEWVYHNLQKAGYDMKTNQRDERLQITALLETYVGN